jgi:mono/diheme cytochrome c family protein
MKKALILAAALGLTVGGAFAQDKGKGKGAAGDAKAGKEVFEGNCGVCHDTGTEARVGPGLKGVTKKATLVTKKAPTDANLLELLNGGSGSMPAFADLMNAKEKADVIAFVKTL